MILSNLKLVFGVRYFKKCLGCGLGSGIGKIFGKGYKG